MFNDHRHHVFGVVIAPWDVCLAAAICSRLGFEGDPRAARYSWWRGLEARTRRASSEDDCGSDREWGGFPVEGWL